MSAPRVAAIYVRNPSERTANDYEQMANLAGNLEQALAEVAKAVIPMTEELSIARSSDYEAVRQERDGLRKELAEALKLITLDTKGITGLHQELERLRGCQAFMSGAIELQKRRIAVLTEVVDLVAKADVRSDTGGSPCISANYRTLAKQALAFDPAETQTTPMPKEKDPDFFDRGDYHACMWLGAREAEGTITPDEQREFDELTAKYERHQAKETGGQV